MKQWSGVFEKLSKSETDWESYVNVAVNIKISRGICVDSRIVTGSVTSRPVRFHNAEKIVNGAVISLKKAEEAAEDVKAALMNVTSASSLRDYRVHAAGVLVKRCILKAAGLTSSDKWRVVSGKVSRD